MSTHTKRTLEISGVILVILMFLVFFDIRHDEHISFSRKSGYYDSPFDLVISGGNGNKIYYTLDGREPTMEDFLFDKDNPIYIDDAAGHANTYSTRTDISTISRDELYFAVPEYNIDKCNIVRASVFDKNGSCLDSITGVYFINLQDKTAYEGIYTASIVTDPANLFDAYSGIYVTGAMAQSDANYLNRGRDWEREAAVTIFDSDHNTILTQDCGIRIKGGKSRHFAQKSFHCFARTEYNGSNVFQADLFQTNCYPHEFDFYAGGNDNAFKLKDYFANTLEQDLAFATMDFIPCAVFLNGEYWGIYYITENYGADYISKHYNVNPDNIIMVKANELDEGNDSDIDLYYDMKEFISYNYMFEPENYEKACDLIDIDSYIDYYAAQIYIARCADWPSSNFALWRTRKYDNSPYGDCKWRWMLYDVNYGGLELGLVDADTLENILNEDRMFYSLFQNEAFRCQFVQRIQYIGKEVYSPEQCDTFIDNYVQTMRTPLMESNRRFYMNTNSENFDQYVENMRGFFRYRYDNVWSLLVNHMGEEWLEQNGIQK